MAMRSSCRAKGGTDVTATGLGLRLVKSESDLRERMTDELRYIECFSQEWDVCQEFDQRFGDVEWVRQRKHWPPAMLDALSSFLALQ